MATRNHYYICDRGENNFSNCEKVVFTTSHTESNIPKMSNKQDTLPTEYLLAGMFVIPFAVAIWFRITDKI